MQSFLTNIQTGIPPKNQSLAVINSLPVFGCNGILQQLLIELINTGERTQREMDEKREMASTMNPGPGRATFSEAFARFHIKIVSEPTHVKAKVLNLQWVQFDMSEAQIKNGLRELHGVSFVNRFKRDFRSVIKFGFFTFQKLVHAPVGEH